MEKYKKVIKNNKSKISAPTLLKSLNYLVGHIRYQVFKITLNLS